MKLPSIKSVTLAVGLGATFMLHSGPLRSRAGLIDTTGTIQTLTAPSDVSRGAWESDGKTRLFQERAGAILAGDLTVDSSAPGQVNHDLFNISPSVVAEGTAVDTWLLHQDRIGSEGYIFTSGSITFDCKILGVIFRTQSLDATDALLGAAGTNYGTGGDIYRGLDVPGTRHDSITLSEDCRTLSFALRTGLACDQIRIITAAVPAPGSLVLLAISAFTALGRRRRPPH
jgi:hypothetical protein